MSHLIPQRELRNSNAEIMRRVQAGESFTVTRNGRPVADLVPHRSERGLARTTLGEAQAAFRGLPGMDAERWRRERESDDNVFGSDDPLDQGAIS